jgi:hypothetical protein
VYIAFYQVLLVLCSYHALIMLILRCHIFIGRQKTQPFCHNRTEVILLSHRANDVMSIKLLFFIIIINKD